MPNPNRGEVWLVDLGYAAKVRPCLVLSIPAQPTRREHCHTPKALDRSAQGNTLGWNASRRFLP
jgi:mRNA interferase MazF